MIALTVGPNVNVEQSKGNREQIEIALATTRIAVLPQGEIVLDKPMNLVPGCRVVGAGRENTILRAAVKADGECDPAGQWTYRGSPEYGEMRHKDSRKGYRLYFDDPTTMPIAPLESARLENLTVGGLSSYLSHGLEAYRVRFADAVKLWRCSNVRMDECDLAEPLYLESVEDSEFLCIRGKRILVSARSVDLFFWRCRLVSPEGQPFEMSPDCENICWKDCHFHWPA
jgi:hypothetical protein